MGGLNCSGLFLSDYSGKTIFTHRSLLAEMVSAILVVNQTLYLGVY